MSDVASGDMSATIGAGGNMLLMTRGGSISSVYAVTQGTGGITAVATLLNATGGNISASTFDYDPVSGKYYANTVEASKTYLYSFATAFAFDSRVKIADDNLDLQSQSPGPNGNLWAIERATGVIYEINTTTGQISQIVSVPVNQLQGDGFESLAVAPRTDNNLLAGQSFTINMTADFGTVNVAAEKHFFLVELGAAALAGGLEVTSTGGTSVLLAAGNAYGLAAGRYLKVDAGAVDGSGSALVTLRAPLTSDAFGLNVYAVEEDTRTDAMPGNNVAVTAVSTQSFTPIYEQTTTAAGSYSDLAKGTAISGGTGANTLAGNDGDDAIYGGDGSDTITGGNGNDRLHGGAGHDTIGGDASNDLLIGGAGDYVMTGGIGADVFRWSLADKGAAGTPAIDRITDFDNVTNSDRLDLRDLLQGETSGSTDAGNLAQYLHFELSGTDTILHVSSSGGFTGGAQTVGGNPTPGAEDQRILFSGVNLINPFGTDQAVIQDLLTRGKLTTD